jgi:hypothetical protein
MAKRVFCGEGCGAGWREDRRAGLIYQAVRTPAGAWMSWYGWHEAAGACPYCREVVRPRVHARAVREGVSLPA